MISCFCLSQWPDGMSQSWSPRSEGAGGEWGDAFCKSEFLTFKTIFSCFQGHVSCQKFTLTSGLYVYRARVWLVCRQIIQCWNNVLFFAFCSATTKLYFLHPQLDKPFPPSCEQRNQKMWLEAWGGKILCFVWICPHESQPHFLAFPHCSGMQKRSVFFNRGVIWLMMFISKLVSNIPLLMWSNMLSSIQYCKYRYFTGIATNVNPLPSRFIAIALGIGHFTVVGLVS